MNGGSGVSIGGFRILRVGCFGYITPPPEINECHLKRDQDSKGKDGLPTSIFQGICCPTGILAHRTSEDELTGCTIASDKQGICPNYNISPPWVSLK